eukprot:gene48215-26661_t
MQAAIDAMIQAEEAEGGDGRGPLRPIFLEFAAQDAEHVVDVQDQLTLQRI